MFKKNENFKEIYRSSRHLVGTNNRNCFPRNLKKLTLRLGTLKRDLLYQLMVRSLIYKSQLCKLKLYMIFVYAKNIELRMYETRIKKVNRIKPLKARAHVLIAANRKMLGKFNFLCSFHTWVSFLKIYGFNYY